MWKLNRDEAEQMDADAGSGAGKFFQTVQPQRDLESNWAVDLAKNLEEYLLKICSGEISGDDDSHLSINFAEAALLLQGSIQVYSRKVEYLYSLVLHALEFISQKSQQEQTPGGESDQPVESGPNAAVSEENDSFWGLDDIPVDTKNLLDSATCREATLNHFVRPPANLVVLEGDCLDATGDAGELESYLLANNDLYRDFILLDSCDAVVVNDFLDGDVKSGNGQSTICRGSSLTSKGRKSFQSPIRRSGSVGHKLSVGKNQNATSNLSPQVNHGFEFNDPNDASFPPAYDSPENNNHEFGMEDGYIDSTDSDDSEDDDPWKPLNPYEPGNLKIKPYKRVKANRRRDVGSKKHILTTEFPLAKLQGTISSELNQIWETRRRAVGGENESKSPPLYEKLRQSLVVGGNIDHDAFCNSMDNNENNGYDSGDPDIGPPDFDMPDMDEELPANSDKNNDGGIHFDNDEAYGDPVGQTSLEDLCRSHLDALLASLSETEKQTEMAARVSTWKQRIEQNLEEQDARPPFDIHQYGERILDKLSPGQDSGNSMSFGDVVRGQEKHDVARTFSALLQLVNNGDVDLERGVSGHESTCYTAGNPFYIRFLRREKKRDHVKLQLSKKRAKSPMMKGHGRGEKNKSGKENQPIFNLSPSESNSTCRLSLKVGKSGGIRCTPEGKKRRKSRLIEPVDIRSGE